MRIMFQRNRFLFFLYIYISKVSVILTTILKYHFPI